MNHNQKFQFRCHSEIKCFNACCQDLHQVLAPYDILRLKYHFQINSSQFLKTYTQSYIGPETGLPVVVLNTKSQMDLRCIFVSEKGCLVYPNRPASCRYYPLARMISRSRITGEKKATFMLIQEAHCMGHDEKENTLLCQQTVDSWIKSQELTDYDKHNDQMLELIAAKNTANKNDLSEHDKQLFFMCCYDIDLFKNYAAERNFFTESQQSTYSLENDIKMLDYSLKWIQQKLF